MPIICHFARLSSSDEFLLPFYYFFAFDKFIIAFELPLSSRLFFFFFFAFIEASAIAGFA